MQYGSDSGKAYARYPELYQTYTLALGYVNGFSYYVSWDNKYAIYLTPDPNDRRFSQDWMIGLKSEL